METYYIQIPTNKKDFFLSLMKELDFVKISDNFQDFEHNTEEYIRAILDSEEDIEQGNVISHSELKKEVQTWLK